MLKSVSKSKTTLSWATRYHGPICHTEGADQRATTHLDTNTLEYDLVPLDLKDNVVVIMNTNKRRELADSKYNERRAECETAVSELQEKLDIQTLGELTLDI